MGFRLSNYRNIYFLAMGENEEWENPAAEERLINNLEFNKVQKRKSEWVSFFQKKKNK